MDASGAALYLCLFSYVFSTPLYNGRFRGGIVPLSVQLCVFYPSLQWTLQGRHCTFVCSVMCFLPLFTMDASGAALYLCLFSYVFSTPLYNGHFRGGIVPLSVQLCFLTLDTMVTLFFDTIPFSFNYCGRYAGE